MNCGDARTTDSKQLKSFLFLGRVLLLSKVMAKTLLLLCFSGVCSNFFTFAGFFKVIRADPNIANLLRYIYIFIYLFIYLVI